MDAKTPSVLDAERGLQVNRFLESVDVARIHDDVNALRRALGQGGGLCRSG
jgi:hypothetical protein